MTDVSRHAFGTTILHVLRAVFVHFALGFVRSHPGRGAVCLVGELPTAIGVHCISTRAD
jgi:hypothetical protein